MTTTLPVIKEDKKGGKPNKASNTGKTTYINLVYVTKQAIINYR